MNDVIQQINLYHNLFRVCLVLALIFLVVAITVFFMLDIKSTIGYLTGRRARKKIKELEAANAESGRLISKSRSMQYVDQKMKSDMGVRQAAAPGIRKVEHVVEPVAEPIMQQTEVQQATGKMPFKKKKSIMEIQNPDVTQLLENNQSSIGDYNNTTVLAEGMNSSYIEETSTAVLEEKISKKGHFLIIRELMLIHTEEVI